ncbi:ABC transporter ATP-binding protein, partial [Micromonospora vinacea]|uniref:ABC transporter ATP-binding protein n=1 Tax=Micromonospora vinacea TaxID=709878 RepID=UPI0034561499
QSRPVPSGVTVRDVVGYGRHPYRGRWRTEDPDGPAAIARAMDVTGVAAMADRPVDELSGGELQRVWLATCLAQDTPVLLLDEPTTFLDLRYQVEILDLVRELADDHGVAVGVVLHDLNQAAAVADEVVLLHQGRVRATGTPATVFTENALTETYGIRIEVTTDPVSGLVTTRPVGRHQIRALV